MLQFAIFTYGLLTSFVLSGASRNRRLERPNSPVLDYCGYVLMGVSGASSVILFAYAGWHALTS
jgi:hypothetical protein